MGFKIVWVDIILPHPRQLLKGPLSKGSPRPKLFIFSELAIYVATADYQIA